MRNLKKVRYKREEGEEKNFEEKNSNDKDRAKELREKRV